MFIRFFFSLSRFTFSGSATSQGHRGFERYGSVLSQLSWRESLRYVHHNEQPPPPLTPLNISSIIHAHSSFSRHNEHVLPDSFEPVGKSTEFSQRRQPEPVSAGSKCNTQILNFCANFIFLFYVSFYRYPRNLVLVDVRKK